jgi:hypothetical protein
MLREVVFLTMVQVHMHLARELALVHIQTASHQQSPALLPACCPARRPTSAAGRRDIQTGQAVLVSKLDTLLQRQQAAIDAMNAANSQLAAIQSLTRRQADAIAALDAATNDRLNAISVATQQGIINLYQVCLLAGVLMSKASAQLELHWHNRSTLQLPSSSAINEKLAS